MKKKKILIVFLLVFSMLLTSFAFYAYQVVFTANILVGREDIRVYIKKGITFEELRREWFNNGYIQDAVSFSLVAKIKGYDTSIKPGCYILRKDMSNLDAITLLRSGKQVPIRVTFGSCRRLSQLPYRVSKYFSFNSQDLYKALFTDSIAEKYGFNKYTFKAMFLPNTYEFYWTNSPKDFLDRMKYEYIKFWNSKREKKQKKLNLTKVEVSILASMVQAETNKLSEAPTISGVYLNRLKKNMRLQADPTLIYGMNDFKIQRVLNSHKKVDSPYNTYRYRGLPIGPINIPIIPYIDAVLNYEEHDYIFFCAKDDFSGYHNFAKILKEHNRNARKFQKALDRAKIFK